MYKIDFMTRMIMSTVIVAIYYLFVAIICKFISCGGSVLYVLYFAIGSYGYHIIDWLIYRWRHRK